VRAVTGTVEIRFRSPSLRFAHQGRENHRRWRNLPGMAVSP